jgi:O-antigen ligase
VIQQDTQVLRQANILLAGATMLALAALAVAVALDRPPMLFVAAMIGAACTALVVATPELLSWRNLITAVILVILFIPIRRYALPGNLPFQLEPYRLLIGLVGLAWIASLLVDPKVRAVRSPLHAPLLAIVLVCGASITFNVHRIEDLQVSQDVLKQFTFLLSFVLVFMLVVSVVRTFEQIDFLLKILVGGGAVLSVFALVELWTGINAFNQLDRFLPFLQATGGPENALLRAGRLRVYASAQHPIGLGELLVLLIPMAVYIAIASRRRIWFAAALLLGLAAFSTVSRTAVVSLAAIAVVFLILRPAATLKFWPLVLPGLIAVHIAMPGVLGSMYKGIFPQGGLIAQEAGASVGSSRTASFGPGLEEVGKHPLVGGGYGSRIPVGPDANSFIVDNQWLSTGMETGIAGVFVWVWLFVRFLRRMFRAAKRDHSERGWLFVGSAAAAAGFAIGMATYDSFSFIQAMLVLFILLALGCAGLAAREREDVSGARKAI